LFSLLPFFPYGLARTPCSPAPAPAFALPQQSCKLPLLLPPVAHTQAMPLHRAKRQGQAQGGDPKYATQSCIEGKKGRGSSYGCLCCPTLQSADARNADEQKTMLTKKTVKNCSLLGQHCGDGGVATGRAQHAQQEAGQAVIIFGIVAILRGRTGGFGQGVLQNEPV